MLSVRQKLKLVSFSLGIFACYSVFGVIQERIFRCSYKEDKNDEGEIFTYSVAFVAIQSIACSIFAKGVMNFQGDRMENQVHQKFYLLTAIFYTTATVTSNMALKWISYPTQVVAKASKPIPVMIFGVLMGGKSYAPQKYLFVLMIVFGVGLFMYKDTSGMDSGSVLGNSLIAVSLLMDGLTGAAQDRLRAHSKPSTMDFMCYLNGWSSCILITLMAVTGEGRDLISFASRHPLCILHLGLAVFVGTAGQIFISAMISNFGSLPLCLVTTIRKFFTVFISVMMFGNALSQLQWIATLITFLALLLDSIFGKKSLKSDETLAVVDKKIETYKNSSNLSQVEVKQPVS